MGRPRSEEAHQKVLEAALDLIAERGVDATSMDAIAERSGVSKATIYKHWADKPALMLDVIADLHGVHNRPSFDTGDIRADMLAVLSHKPPRWHLSERIMPHFMAYSAKHREFGEAWRRQVMDAPQRELKRLIEAGIESGQLRTGLDLDIGASMLLGPLLYVKIFLPKRPVPVNLLPETIVDAFWKAFGAFQPRS